MARLELALPGTWVKILYQGATILTHVDPGGAAGVRLAGAWVKILYQGATILTHVDRVA